MVGRVVTQSRPTVHHLAYVEAIIADVGSYLYHVAPVLEGCQVLGVTLIQLLVPDQHAVLLEDLP